LRILIVDDHRLFSQGLQFLLSDLNPEANCVCVTSVQAALACTATAFDLILLDLRLPDSHHGDGLEKIRLAYEGTPVVILSGETQLDLIRDLIERGAAGFIPKSADTEVLMQALHTILAGGVYLPPESITPQATNPALEPLTDRQVEVLLKLMQGKSNRAIASDLNISENTVKTHLAIAFRHLGVSSRTEAVFKAAALGLTAPPAAQA
jgi:DNA-binding NarL/FixJ family response regulator